MTRHIPMNERTRPYRITRTATGWTIWDRRRHIGTDNMGNLLAPGWPVTTWAHPTHTAAIAALDAHLRGDNGHGSTGVK